MTRLLRVIPMLIVLVAVAIGVGACGTNKIQIPASDQTSKQDQSAATIFNQRCGGCHTLSYAGTHGSGQNPRTYEDINGPNFNVRCERPVTRVLYAIENGGFSGAYMPQNIVVGQQARQVAMFVSKFAGRQAPGEPDTVPCDKQSIGTLPALGSPAAPSSAPAAASGSATTGTGTTTSAGTGTTTSAAAGTTTAGTSTAATAAKPSGGGKTTNLALAVKTGGMLMFDKKTLTAPAGNVTITLTNSTAIPHDVAVQVGTNGKVLGATPTFTNGTRSLTLKGLKPGKYTFFCTVPGHRQAGMVGTLTIS